MPICIRCRDGHGMDGKQLKAKDFVCFQQEIQRRIIRLEKQTQHLMRINLIIVMPLS